MPFITGISFLKPLPEKQEISQYGGYRWRGKGKLNICVIFCINYYTSLKYVTIIFIVYLQLKQVVLLCIYK